MRIGVLSLGLVLSLSLTGCVGVRGSGNKAEEARKVAPFSSVKLNGGYQVDLQVANTQPADVSLLLSGDNNLLPLVKTVVSGGLLTLDSEENLWTNLPMTLQATTGPLQSITVNGSAQGRVSGLTGDKLTLEVNGSGELTLAGQVKELVLDVAGSGTIDARELQAETVTIDVAGSGEAKVCASKSLKVDVSGSGQVEYYCNPSEVIQDIAGSGEVVKK